MSMAFPHWAATQLKHQGHSGLQPTWRCSGVMPEWHVATPAHFIGSRKLHSAIIWFWGNRESQLGKTGSKHSIKQWSVGPVAETPELHTAPSESGGFSFLCDPQREIGTHDCTKDYDSRSRLSNCGTSTTSTKKSARANEMHKHNHMAMKIHTVIHMHPPLDSSATFDNHFFVVTKKLAQAGFLQKGGLPTKWHAGQDRIMGHH